MIEHSRQRHPAVAAFLSFLFPGLGQAYAGNRRLAVLLALPVLALIVTGFIATALGGRHALNSLLSASFLTALVGLDLALMAWRLFAIAQVGFAPAPAAGQAAVAASPMGAGELMVARRGGTILLVVVLLVTTIGMHAWAGLLVGQLNRTLGDVFSGSGGMTRPGGNPGGPLNLPDYSWDGTERINFLLLGIDTGGQRTSELTDTILAVSIDPAKRKAVLISVPRDTGFMPLPDRSVYADGLYPNKVNGLSTEANDNTELWCPDMPVAEAEACGLRTLQRSVGLYLGIPIHYYATVDLEGFRAMIDAVGGLNLCLPGKIVDDTYTGPGDLWNHRRGVILDAGCRHYDGQRALAYARARKGYMEMRDGTRVQLDDFKRAERQQKMLLELRREFAQLDIFFELSPMLDAIGATVATDFPRAKAGDLASLLPLITAPDIERVVLDLPDFVDPPADPNANYILTPRRDDLRAEMERLFGADYVEGWFIATTDPGPES